MNRIQALAPPRGLFPGSVHVGASRLEVNCVFDSAPQQFVVQHPDPRTNVKQGLDPYTHVPQAVQDQPSGAGRSSATILGQFVLCPGRGEVLIGGLTMTTGHGSG
jgi:hypothetical protein